MRDVGRIWQFRSAMKFACGMVLILAIAECAIASLLLGIAYLVAF